MENIENIKGITLATNNRGAYVLNKNAYVYNRAEGEYKSCQFGNLDYFINSIDRNEDYNFTLSGLKVLGVHKACKQGLNCCLCISGNKAPACLIASMVNSLK